MTIRYVGPGGSDGASGTSWANRKLTLNGVEDTPVVAGDIVYVAPGTYGETLTIDVSGSSGNPITYIGDVTGEHTDGVGGIVRITGTTNGYSASRSYGISATAKDYRTFRGFLFDMVSLYGIYIATTASGYIIEDCSFWECGGVKLSLSSGTTTDTEVRRCLFCHPNSTSSNAALYFSTSYTPYEGGLIHECVFLKCGVGIASGIDAIDVTACTFIGCGTAFYYSGDTSDTATCQNNVVYSCYKGFESSASSPTIISDYCSLSCTVPYTNCSAGANSLGLLGQPALPIKSSTIKLPFDEFLNHSIYGKFTEGQGNITPSYDFYGSTRPTSVAKVTLGAFQQPKTYRETTTTRGSSVASIKFSDAARMQFKVPTDGTSTTISVYAYREANYAGTLPQMVIKQPGQSDRTTTDTGSASQWNQLIDTFTPASSPPYVIVELVSNNTATSGSFGTYFDDLAVS